MLATGKERGRRRTQPPRPGCARARRLVPRPPARQHTPGHRGPPRPPRTGHQHEAGARVQRARVQRALAQRRGALVASALADRALRPATPPSARACMRCLDSALVA